MWKAFTRGGVGVYLSGDGKRKSMMKLELSSEGRRAAGAGIPGARRGAGRASDGRQISAEAAVPRRLLARVMAKLARAGLWRAARGGAEAPSGPNARGGHLRDAVEAVEGPFEITHCIMQQRPCGEGRPAPCTTPGPKARTPSSTTSPPEPSPNSLPAPTLPPLAEPSPTLDGTRSYPHTNTNIVIVWRWRAGLGHTSGPRRSGGHGARGRRSCDFGEWDEAERVG